MPSSRVCLLQIFVKRQWGVSSKYFFRSGNNVLVIGTHVSKLPMACSMRLFGYERSSELNSLVFPRVNGYRIEVVWCGLFRIVTRPIMSDCRLRHQSDMSDQYHQSNYQSFTVHRNVHMLHSACIIIIIIIIIHGSAAQATTANRRSLLHPSRICNFSSKSSLVAYSVH